MTQVLNAPPSKDFKLPAAGVTQGVIAKVIDLGLVTQNKYMAEGTEEVPQIDVWWQLAEKDESGKPHLLRQNYRFSESDNSNLTAFMLNLFGSVPPKGTFNYFKLEGTQRAVVIEHYKTKSGKTRARISTTTKLAANQPKLEIAKFELPNYVLSFPGYKKNEVVKPITPLQGTAVTAAAPIDDSDIPF